MEASAVPQNSKEGHVRPLLKKDIFQNGTEILQAFIQLEFNFQNLRKGSSRSAASSYKKITIYLIHYNQSSGSIILQNQRYLKYTTI